MKAKLKNCKCGGMVEGYGLKGLKEVKIYCYKCNKFVDSYKSKNDALKDWRDK